jgi:hypothetical protein
MATHHAMENAEASIPRSNPRLKKKIGKGKNIV